MARSGRGDDGRERRHLHEAGFRGRRPAQPFYDQERQRDVWNEASAVGFQLMLWLGLIAANIMSVAAEACRTPSRRSASCP